MSTQVELTDKLAGTEASTKTEEYPPEKSSKIARLNASLKGKNCIIVVQSVLNVLLIIAILSTFIYFSSKKDKQPAKEVLQIVEKPEPKPVTIVDFDNSKYFMYELHDRKLFSKEKLLDSKLVTDFDDQFRILSYLPKFPKETKKLYSAKENGCSSAKFHELCDRQGPTLTIIKSAKGYVFGGYTSLSWYNFNCNWQYYTAQDHHSFIFSVDRKIRDMDGNFTRIEKNPMKGPVFGPMIEIADDGCNNENSFTTINPMFKQIQLQDFTEFKEEHFKVEDYEVFKIIY